MASYPIEIRRCRHIRTNGTQCGSPALKEKEFCYYHQENQPRAANLYVDGERYASSDIMVPVLEDAHSIQTALRQVLLLLFERRIEQKDAGLALYALQIASGNLKMMQAEKAKPTQVVVEPERAAETPLGMTPWSASGEGHDPEEEGNEEDEAPAAPLPTSQRLRSCLSWQEARAMRREFVRRGLISRRELHRYLLGDGPEPLLAAFSRLRGAPDEGSPMLENSESAAGEGAQG